MYHTRWWKLSGLYGVQYAAKPAIFQLRIARKINEAPSVAVIVICSDPILLWRDSPEVADHASTPPETLLPLYCLFFVARYLRVKRSFMPERWEAIARWALRHFRGTTYFYRELVHRLRGFCFTLALKYNHFEARDFNSCNPQGGFPVFY